ncbi:15454_t:CDS:1, partial [Racocetra persica]
LFIAWLTKIDGKPFKVESINNCYAALVCYLRENSSILGKVNIWDKYIFSRTIQVLDGKMRSLQDEGYGDTDKSDSLIPNEIVSCLNHEYLSINNNE